MCRYKDLLSQREGSDRFVDAEAQTVEHLQKAKEVQCTKSSATSTEVQVCPQMMQTVLQTCMLHQVKVCDMLCTDQLLTSHASGSLLACKVVKSFPAFYGSTLVSCICA
jgi:hypothetical protein